jgi:hypothetical protein
MYAFVKDLAITALAEVSLRDGSGPVQAAADYCVGALSSLALDGPGRDYGSLPQIGQRVVHIVRYLRGRRSHCEQRNDEAIHRGTLRRCAPRNDS